jgi:hypothetical protein
MTRDVVETLLCRRVRRSSKGKAGPLVRPDRSQSQGNGSSGPVFILEPLGADPAAQAAIAVAEAAGAHDSASTLARSGSKR